MSSLRDIAKIFSQKETQDYCFVFPNRRAGLFFQKYMAQVRFQPFFSPAILTIDECFGEFTNLKIESEIETIFRLYECYIALCKQKNIAAETLFNFIFWGKTLLNDFSDIDNHLISNVKTLFENITNLAQIDNEFDTYTDSQKQAIKRFWESLNGEKRMHQNFVEFWEMLFPLYDNFRESLLADDKAYKGLLNRTVIENFADIPKDKFRKHYVFIGFNVLSKSEETLLLLLKDRGIAEFCFDYDSFFLQDKRNCASFFLRDNVQKFGLTLREGVKNVPAMEAIFVPTMVGEVHAINEVLKRIYPSSDAQNDYSRTAIILPDEELLVPLINTIPSHISQINVTMGYPLRALNSYAPIAQPEKFGLIEHGDAQKTLNELKDKLTENYNPDEEEAYFQLQESITQLTNLIKKYPQFFGNEKDTTSLIFALLKNLTQNSSISYVGDYLKGLQIMGVLECRGLEFDNLIFASFNDELYPGKSGGNTYIPYILRKAVGLPTFEHQDAVYAYNFYRIISYAKKVFFIVNNQEDESHSNEPSRFLYQLKYQYGLAVKERFLQPRLLAPTEKKTIMKDAATLQKIKAIFENGLSPSAINTYIACPVRYYWKYIKEIPEAFARSNAVIDNAEFGTHLHEIMEKIYQPLINQKVTADETRKIKADLKQTIVDYLQEKMGEYSRFEPDLLEEYIGRVLAHDEKECPRIVALEQQVEKDIFLKNGQRVRLKGKIDRIDEVGKERRIIDYKTGRSDNRVDDEKMEELFSNSGYKYVLQTFIYAMICPNTSPYLFAVRKKEDIASKVHFSRGRKKEEVPFQEMERDFMCGLQDVLSEILDGEKPFAPKVSACTNCAFSDFCASI